MINTIKNITVIGAGGVATSLIPAFIAKGFNINCIYSRHIESAQILAKKYNCSSTDDLSHVSNNSDLYLICITDDAVASVAKELHIRKDAICVHTAGSLSMNLLSGLTQNFGIFYPMQTFSKGRIVDFNDVPLFIEASNEETKTRLHEVAEKLSNKIYDLNEEGRRKLHLAAVFACNFSNHCYSIAEDLLNQQGLPFNVLLPLIDETARKVHTISPLLAQTGPAVRNNKCVINNHKNMLIKRNDLREIYNILTENIINYHKPINND